MDLSACLSPRMHHRYKNNTRFTDKNKSKIKKKYYVCAVPNINDDNNIRAVSSYT